MEYFSNTCFLCGKDNDIGLKLRFYEEGEFVKTTKIILSKKYCGFRDIIHGGIVSGILDEVMWYAVALQGKIISLTADMSIRLKQSMKPNEEYIAVAKLEKVKKKLYYTSGYIKKLNNNDIIASAKGIYLPMKNSNLDKFFEENKDALWMKNLIRGEEN